MDCLDNADILAFEFHGRTRLHSLSEMKEDETKGQVHKIVIERGLHACAIVLSSFVALNQSRHIPSLLPGVKLNSSVPTGLHGDLIEALLCHNVESLAVA